MRLNSPDPSPYKPRAKVGRYPRVKKQPRPFSRVEPKSAFNQKPPLYSVMEQREKESRYSR